jgi:hypothetical protein
MHFGQPGHSPEWEAVLADLRSAGVGGVEDFGTFVNDTRYLAPAQFDERAAGPLLLAALPGLTDERLAATIGRYLANRSVGHEAYPIVLEAFRRWAVRDCEAAWVLGDTLSSKATKADVDELVALAVDPRYGRNRQMIVDSLWRFRKTGEVELALRALVRDPDVALHAMSALQRTIGADDMVPVLAQVIDEADDERIAAAARRQLRRIEKKRLQAERGS